MGKKKSNFFSRLGKKLDFTSNKSFLRDISKDSTFKQITGSVVNTGTGVLSGLTGAFKGVTGVFSGNTIYIVLGLVGVGVVGYTVSNFRKK